MCYGFSFLFLNSREHFSLIDIFFPMTVCWVISKALFYRFWFLHSAVFITEFHPVCNLQSMLNYCISNRKQGTCRDQVVLDMLNLELNTPHSHFSCHFSQSEQATLAYHKTPSHFTQRTASLFSHHVPRFITSPVY